MKIIVKNAVKRKPGFLYSINSQGDLVEEAAPPRMRTRDSSSGAKHTDDNQTKGPISMSNSDIKVMARAIRNQSLRRLIELQATEDPEFPTIAAIEKKFKVSKRTAYDYLNTLRALSN